MGIKEFEELEVFKQARELTRYIYSLTEIEPFCRDYGLKDQLRRACVSILSNIAEGFERGSNSEFVQFLYVARGSCGEVRAQVIVAFDQKYIDEKQFIKLTENCKSINRMLNSFVLYLKSSNIKKRNK